MGMEPGSRLSAPPEQGTAEDQTLRKAVVTQGPLSRVGAVHVTITGRTSDHAGRKSSHSVTTWREITRFNILRGVAEALADD